MKDCTVVLIGGTFNPFTIAHRKMALFVRRMLPEADIVYIPSNLTYIAEWKNMPDNKVFSGSNRISLIQKSIKDIPNCYVSDIESTGIVSGRSYETVQYLKKEYNRVYLCVGSDKLYEIERWYKAEELLKEVEIILFTRGETVKECTSDFVRAHMDKITEINFEYPEVSSSLIRELYECGDIEKIKAYVPDPVYEYLKS